MKKIKNPLRLHFPEDEMRYHWLPMLLDAYTIIDKGVALAVKVKEKEDRTKLACRRGCDVCCRSQKDIPVYPLEMVGIYWYAIEKIGGPLRVTLRSRLLNHGNAVTCPFLMDVSCSVHPLRPVACRQFNVFRRPCDEGEDPYYTRKGDVLMPIRDYTDRALSTMLPFYGVTDEKAKAEVIKKGLLHAQARVLQSLNWSELVKRMDDFDLRRAEKGT